MMERRAEEFNLHGSHVLGLFEAAKSFFGDSSIIWPLHYYSAYYLGHVPNLDLILSRQAVTGNMMHSQLLHNVHGDLHIAGICLASCIWGIVQRDMARQREDNVVHGTR
jgi:hypothetical protein